MQAGLNAVTALAVLILTGSALVAPVKYDESDSAKDEMARIDPVRRAQIGQEKRARTRAQLISAATSLFAKRAIETVTVDDVVTEAGVAKGTFYVHFDDLQALTRAVADELIGTLDEFLQPQRQSISDPLMRVALGCHSFIEKGSGDPAWANVVARMAASWPSVGKVARSRLFEDLRLVFAEAPPRELSLELALEVVVGILLQVLTAIGQGRLSADDSRGAIAAILRAIGIGASEIRSVLSRLTKLTEQPPSRGRSRRAN
jgi:AcrR family transcriptional regulator